MARPSRRPLNRRRGDPHPRGKQHRHEGHTRTVPTTRCPRAGRRAAARGPAGPVSYDDDYRSRPPPARGQEGLRSGWSAARLRRHWWQALLLWSLGSAGLVALAYTKIKPTFDAVAAGPGRADDTGIFDRNSTPVDFAAVHGDPGRHDHQPDVLGAALAEHPELDQLADAQRTPTTPRPSSGQALRVGIVPRTNLIQVELSSPRPGRGGRRWSTPWSTPTSRRREDLRRPRPRSEIEQLKETRDEQQSRSVDKQRHESSRTLRQQIGAADVDGGQGPNSTTIEHYQRSERAADRASRSSGSPPRAKLDQLRSREGAARPPGRQGGRIDEAVARRLLRRPRVVGAGATIEPGDDRSSRRRRAARPGTPATRPRQRVPETVKDLTDAEGRALGKLEPSLRRQVAAGPGRRASPSAIEEAEVELTRRMTTHEDSAPATSSTRSRSRTSNAEAERAQAGVRPPRPPARRGGARPDRADAQPARVRGQEPDRPGRAGVPGQAVDPAQLRPPDAGHGRRAGGHRAGRDGRCSCCWSCAGAGWATPRSCPAGCTLQVIGVVPPLPQIRPPAVGRSGDGWPAGRRRRPPGAAAARRVRAEPRPPPGRPLRPPRPLGPRPALRADHQRLRQRGQDDPGRAARRALRQRRADDPPDRRRPPQPDPEPDARRRRTAPA